MAKKIYVKANGNSLTECRIRAGLSKSDLARQIGVHHSNISRAEAGNGVSPKTAKKICDKLEKPFDEIFSITRKDVG